MQKIKNFFSGTFTYLTASEDGSIIWAVEQVIRFVKSTWQAASERLNALSESRNARLEAKEQRSDDE